MPVLDTSFLIDLERGDPDAEAVLERLAADAEPLIVPAQVAIEYLSGIEDRTVGLHMIDSSFLLSEVTREQVLEAARIAREAIGRGEFPGWADVQVAAVAILEATPVVTANPRHFRALGCEATEYRRAPRRRSPKSRDR